MTEDTSESIPEGTSRGGRLAIAALMAALGVAPIVLYRVFLDRLPELGPLQAADLDGRLSSVAPYLDSTPIEQWAVSISAFGVKPLYMLLTLGLILVLRRSPARDLAALRWALIFFLAGEVFCAINYLFFGEDSYLVEYLHCYGMVLAFGFTALAVIEALDERILGVRDRSVSCAALTVCPACYKHRQGVRCGAHNLTIHLIPLVIVVALMPLLAPIHDVSYNTTIVGTPYNYHHPAVLQIFELRYLPVAAIALLAAAFVVLRRAPSPDAPTGRLLLALGVGFLGFSLFRLIIHGVYLERLAWFIVTEEVLELLSVVLIGIVLWLFRHRLLSVPGPD
jgi:hypothetical protein